MFASTDSRLGAAGLVDIAFTDRYGGVSPPPYDSLDLGAGAGRRTRDLEANLARVVAGFAVTGLTTMRQVHGSAVSLIQAPASPPPTCDGLVTTVADVALCVRVADCVPVVLADANHGVIGVAHAGRPGVVAGVVGATVDTMRAAGASQIEAWIGPHICGGCYEVPADLRAEVAKVAPRSFACTTWGTPAVDVGAAVRAQLTQRGCAVIDLARCTRESEDLYSYRRDRDRSGRLAGLVVLRGSSAGGARAGG